MYTLNDFDFELPERLIAQRPAEPRDHSRLLVYDRRTRTITDDVFYNLGHWLPASSTIVVNNSKVEKARMVFGNTEVFVLRQVNDRICEALVRPGKKFRPGKVIELASGLQAKVLEVQEDGVRVLELSPSLTDAAWEPFRLTPFPPYIGQDENLAANYQTVYARDEGSKAAPTAGLHFTDGLLSSLRDSGHRVSELTLHVGMGTFAPVKADRIEDHVMHSEWYSIDEKTAAELNEARHIVAVGTTSARTLESVVRADGTTRGAAAPGDGGPGEGYSSQRTHSDNASEGSKQSPTVQNADGGTGDFWTNGNQTAEKHQTQSNVQFAVETVNPASRRRSFSAGSGTTDIFIRPGFKFGAVDSLITNFHLPKSTLLMLVSAMCSVDEMHKIYAHAIEQEYRFYSFGDAMLIR